MSCSPTLEACQLEDIQATVAGMLSDKADIYRLRIIGPGVDERSRGREKWPDDYAIHLSEKSVNVSTTRQQRFSESVQGGQVRAKGDWMLSFLAGTDINARDVVKVTTLNNRVFNVIGLLNGSDEVIRIAEANEIV